MTDDRPWIIGKRDFLADADIVIRAHFYEDDTFRLCVNIPARFGRLICSRCMPMTIYPVIERGLEFND